MNSVCLVVHQPGHEGSVLRSAIGVDVQASLGAPPREGLRVDVDLLDDGALSFKALLAELGALEPFVEGEGKITAVFKQFPQVSVVFSPVPGHTDHSERDLIHGGPRDAC